MKNKLTELIKKFRSYEINGIVIPTSSEVIAERLIENVDMISNWISVNDRLPDETGKYIVCTAKNTVYCSKYYANGKHFGTDMNTHITHWMPLPAPPKGVQ